MVAFYVFSSLNTNHRYIITCVFSFLCWFLIFPYLHFQFLQKSHLSLLFCVEKQLSATINPYTYKYVLVLYCMKIPLINYIYFLHLEINTFSACLLSCFVYFILCLRVIIYLYYFPWSHNIYIYILPVKCIVLQTTDGQKRQQDEHSITLTNTYRDKHTCTDMFRLIHIVLHTFL